MPNFSQNSAAVQVANSFSAGQQVLGSNLSFFTSGRFFSVASESSSSTGENRWAAMEDQPPSATQTRKVNLLNYFIEFSFHDISTTPIVHNSDPKTLISFHVSLQLKFAPKAPPQRKRSLTAPVVPKTYLFCSIIRFSFFFSAFHLTKC